MREIRVFLRSYKAFLCLLFFLGSLFVIVQLNWSAFMEFWRPDLDIAWGARFFFYSLASGLLFLILFLTPFLLAPSIVEEREKKTIDLLISSPISIVHLILAKLLSPLLYIILLLTAAIPALALCLLGGGLGLADIGYTYVIFLTTAVMYSCLGLMCSTLRPRVYEVYLIAAGLMIMLSLIIPYHGSLWTYVSEVSWKQNREINHGFQVVSPFYVLRRVIFTPSPMTRENLLFLYMAASAAAGVIMLAAAYFRIRCIASGAGARVADDEFEEEDYWSIRDRGGDITFDMTSLDGNPGLVLERRVQWFARLPVLLRLFYGALMLSIVTLPLASYQGSWLFLSLPFVSAALFTLPLAATSISSDYERETLSMLRTTLLSSRQIIQAKFITSLQYSFLIALALYLPGMLVQLVCGLLGFEVDLADNPADVFAMILYPVILFFSLVMYTAWGVFCSAYFRRSNRALIVAGLFIAGTLSAPFLLPPIKFFALSSSSYFFTFGVMFLSPLAGVSLLFPPGSIKYLERSLFEIQTLSHISYGYTLGQCAFFCVITYYLLKKAEHALENRE
ncbi:MAG: ABC transporter permease subunit [Candidatus Hinthialibacter sp.]